MDLQPINPPSDHRIVKACQSCGEDVRCDTGFADLDGAFGTFYCGSCAAIALRPEKAGEIALAVSKPLGVV